jgi:hypothetical protein
MMLQAHLGDTIEQVGIWPFDNLLSSAITAAAKAAHPATTAKPIPGNANVQTDPVLVYTYSQANKIYDIIKQAGIPEPAATYALYQAYHETGAFTNNGVKKYNNYSGIMYAKQKGATKAADGYAIFDNLKDWAAALKHELTKGANPAGAKTLEDYAARLKKNGYFTDTLSNYTSGLKAARLVLKELPAADRATMQPDGGTQDPQDLDIPGTTNNSKKGGALATWWNGLNTPEQVGLGAGVTLLLVLAIKD